jgi:hypothetical protein
MVWRDLAKFDRANVKIGNAKEGWESIRDRMV